VFFWQQADSFDQYLLAILKALVWPAFLVYEVFQGEAARPPQSRRTQRWKGQHVQCQP
jgi:hypothetical protein